MNSGATLSRSLRTVPVRDIKDSARELRQRGSNYRCCIPALAGFVSPQSIAPDGKQIFSQQVQRATLNFDGFWKQAFPAGKIAALTSYHGSVCIAP